jgi:hypothetical protein
LIGYSVIGKGDAGDDFLGGLLVEMQETKLTFAVGWLDGRYVTRSLKGPWKKAVGRTLVDLARKPPWILKKLMCIVVGIRRLVTTRYSSFYAKMNRNIRVVIDTQYMFAGLKLYLLFEVLVYQRSIRLVSGLYSNLYKQLLVFLFTNLL